MGWAHNYKPPSGIPAKGLGKGEGWGGPPRGAGNGSPRSHITRENSAEYMSISQDPEKMEEIKRLKASDAERIAQLKEHLGNLALNAKAQETQVTATIALLNRIEGMPKQKIESTGANGGPIQVEDTRKPIEDFVAEFAVKRPSKPVTH